MSYLASAVTLLVHAASHTIIIPELSLHIRKALKVWNKNDMTPLLTAMRRKKEISKTANNATMRAGS